MPRMKEALLRVSKEGETTYKGIRIRLVSDFSLTTWNARGLWGNKLKNLKKIGFRPRILCPAKQSSKGTEKYIFSHGRTQKGTPSHVAFLSKLF